MLSNTCLRLDVLTTALGEDFHCSLETQCRRQPEIPNTKTVIEVEMND